MSKDIAYFRERAATEHALAKAATDAKAAAIHNELAEAYEAILKQAEPRPKLSIVTAEPTAPSD